MTIAPEVTLTNVWSGEDALENFLKLRGYPPTPLIELPKSLNPLREEGVRLYAKRMDCSPLSNIKSIAALYLLEEAKKDGRLDGVHTLVESSSGNTGFSLAVYARYFGISRVVVVVPSDIAPGKEQMLDLAGADIIKFRKGKQNGVELAKKMGEEPGWFCPMQYENPANLKAHREYTGPQVYADTAGQLTVFAAGMGTSGTALGCHQFLKSQNRSIRTIGVMLPPDDDEVPGVRTEKRLRETGFNWADLDLKVMVGHLESYGYSMQLCRAGMLVGPSSGFAYAGLLRVLQEHYESGGLNLLRNRRDEEVVGVFICPDSPLPYLDKYSTQLSPADGF